MTDMKDMKKTDKN